MISRELRMLLEWRQELRDLFNATKYDALRSKEHAQHFVEMAKRISQIVQEWPEDAWPLEEGEDSFWPDQDDMLNYLQAYVSKVNGYSGGFELEDYFNYSWIRLELHGILYYFRKENDEEELDS